MRLQTLFQWVILILRRPEGPSRNDMAISRCQSTVVLRGIGIGTATGQGCEAGDIIEPVEFVAKW